MDPTDPEVACFEAGVKFGSLYHQFAGTPASPESAPSLETAIERAIENQPHCTGVSVSIDRERLAEEAVRGYVELSGRHMTVTVTVSYEGVEATARMAMEDGYPLMRVESVERADADD